MSGPVLVTHHGRPRAVLVSAEEFEHLGRGDGMIGGHPVGAEGDADVIVDHMLQGLIVLDADLVVRRANRAAAAYFKRSPEGLMGARLSDLYPALIEATKTRILQRVLKTGQATSFEAPSALYPGQQLKFDAFPLGDGVAYLFQAVQDEEERHVLAEHDALKALFEAHGAAGMARLSVRGTFAAIDRSLLALTGFERNDLITARLVDLVPLSRRVELREALEKVLNGEGAAAVSTELMTRAGPEIPVTIAMSELREGFAIDGVAVLVTPRAL